MKTRFAVVLLSFAMVGLTVAIADDFIVNVKIGSCDAGVSLTFGKGTNDEQPLPPIS